MRLVVALAWVAIWGTAHAQPAPRTTLDVSLPVPDGFVFDPYMSRGRLAIGRNGVHYLVLNTFKPTSDRDKPMAAARIDLLAVAPDGTVQRRRTLPYRQPPGDRGLNALGVAVARSGDLAVFICSGDPTAGNDHEVDAAVLRLAADFSLKKTARIGPAHGTRWRAAGGFYGVGVTLPTSDNALVLGGGYGIGPQAWWMGKFSLDGVRLWQSGAGNGFPERVAALAQRPDGTLLSVVAEMTTSPPALVFFIRHYTADGRLLARTPAPKIPAEATPVAILRDSIVFLTNGGMSAQHGELIVTDDGGRVRQRAPWPFVQTLSVIDDGDGIAAVVSDADTGAIPTYVARADTRGTVRWRSTAIGVIDIARTPDGRISVLATTGTDPKSLRLVQYADP